MGHDPEAVLVGVPAVPRTWTVAWASVLTSGKADEERTALSATLSSG
jgi:hypothetical protein